MSHVIGVDASLEAGPAGLRGSRSRSPHSAHTPPTPMPMMASTITTSGQRRRTMQVPVYHAGLARHDAGVRLALPRVVLPSLLALLAVTAAAPAAHAGKPKRYHIELIEVTATAGLPAETADALPVCTAEWTKVLASHPQMATLDGAPDAKAATKQFKKWLAKKKIAGSYRMNVEITSYEESLDDKDASINQEKRLTVRLELRTFGETFPERVMGFAAEGSATIKVDVGKKLRPADRAFAIKSACEGAVGDAMTASLTKLALPPPPPAPKPKKR